MCDIVETKDSKVIVSIIYDYNMKLVSGRGKKSFDVALCKEVMIYLGKCYLNNTNIKDTTIRMLGSFLHMISDLPFDEYYDSAQYISTNGRDHLIIIPSKSFIREMSKIAIRTAKDLDFCHRMRYINLRVYKINLKMINKTLKAKKKRGFGKILMYSKHLYANFEHWVKIVHPFHVHTLEDIMPSDIVDIVMEYIAMRKPKTIIINDVRWA